MEQSFIETVEFDDWECDMFGLDGTFRLRPLKGNTPNWFWRWMQFLLIGNRWRKIP